MSSVHDVRAMSDVVSVQRKLGGWYTRQRESTGNVAEGCDL